MNFLNSRLESVVLWQAQAGSAIASAGTGAVLHSGVDVAASKGGGKAVVVYTAGAEAQQGQAASECQQLQFLFSGFRVVVSTIGPRCCPVAPTSTLQRKHGSRPRVSACQRV